MTLPSDFITYTKELFGEERWQRYLAAFSEDMPVSIRLNPFKWDNIQPNDQTTRRPNDQTTKRLNDQTTKRLNDNPPVPWCRNAYYLPERPNFTLDPLLHAGAYYVQEAGSMFLDEVLRQHMPEDGPLTALDLCAAPGGKSTLLRAALPEGSLLYSNEPDRRRANILMENMQKQGHPDVIVTNNFPRDYRKAGLQFDVILTDVPCSGEGMFRKDEGAIGEWSLANVMKCQQLQRSIIEDIWDCLKPGGLLIYSTCTFNLREDEENVRWICEEMGADILPVEIKEEWNITGSLLKGWDEPVYRFIPGTTKGEGLFMAAMRKQGDFLPSRKESMPDTKAKRNKKKSPSKGDLEVPLRILCGGHYSGTVKGKAVIPDHAEALLYNLPADKYPRVELSKDDALHYLHHEAITLPADAPRGFVIVCYEGLALGFVKNIGNRANNLYPQEWKIRNL